MPTSAVIARWCCGLLTLMLAFRLVGARSYRTNNPWVHWWLFVTTGILIALIPLSRRIAHSNLGHYYIGAKYRLPYFDFYRVVTAALDRPQVGYRDLRHPHRFVRRDPLEQRYYALTLLNAAGLHQIPDNAPTTDLLHICSTMGLFRAEAQNVLRQHLDAPSIAMLREDLKRVRLDTDDNGFNGSPVYVLIRQVDPSLHRPFSPLVMWINLFWQFGALLLAIHWFARALGWTAEEQAIAAATLFCSWDFSGWALNGLSFGGWVLPLALALYGVSRQRPILAGWALAWAGTVKLFPFVLAVPLALIWIRAAWTRRQRRVDITGPWRFTTRTLLWASVFTLILAATASRWTGMEWSDFLQKIYGQFERSVFSVNTVSLAQILLALEVPTGRPIIVPALLFIWTLLHLTWGQPLSKCVALLPQSSLILLTLLGWVLGNWFNYYALLSLLLLVHLRKRNPRMAAAFLAFFALTTLLPEYDQCYLGNFRLLGIVKALPYLLLPAWALGTHLFTDKQTQDAPNSIPAVFRPSVQRVVYAVGCVLLMAVLCVSVYRAHAARAAVQLVGVLLKSGQTSEAEKTLRKAQRLDPGNPWLAVHLADLLESSAQVNDARTFYSLAVRLDPDHSYAWMSLGLLSARENKLSDALRLLSRAVHVAPHNAVIRYNYGVALKSAGQNDVARSELQWAVWLQPDFSEARRLLAELKEEDSRP